MASTTLPPNSQSVLFDHVAGIETHRDFHVAVVLAPNGGRLGELTFPASSKGYEQLVIWSEQFGVRPVFAMKGTGSYGAGLWRVLLDAVTARKDDAAAADQAAMANVAGLRSISSGGGLIRSTSR
jgi:transposase